MKIRRRDLLFGTGALAALAGFAGGMTAGLSHFVSRGRSPHRRPNIIFLLTDDQRWDAMGWTGNPYVITPMLDTLAGQSFCFLNNFVTTSICSISRASFLTGQYGRKHGIYEFEIPLPKESMERSYPSLLKQSGYTTGFIGKWGIGHHQIERARFMYDFYDAFPGHGNYYSPLTPNLHLTDAQANSASNFIEWAGTQEKPFFLQLSFKAPHSPYVPSTEYKHFYQSLNIPRFPTDRSDQYKEVPPSIAGSRNRTRWKEFLNTDKQTSEFIKNYYRLVSGVDKALQTIVTKLQKAGQLENTVIIFSSDNGYLIGEHGLWGKWLMYEESIRVPMLLYIPPGLLAHPPQRQMIEHMTLNIDVAPTILQLAGLAVPDYIQGKSLLPLIYESTPSWRKDFLYEHYFTSAAGWIPPCSGLRTERWKYTAYNNNEEVLYDLQEDPLEMHNIAYSPEHRGLCAQMNVRMDELKEALS